MARREYIYIGVFVALVVAAVWVEFATPDPVDWTDTYERGDARPYGAEVLYAVLPDLFPEGEIVPVDGPPYLHLRDTTRTGSAYLFVSTQFAPDPAESGALLDYVSRGNDLFVAARSVGGALADSLGVETETTNPFGAQRALGQQAIGAMAQVDTVRVQFAAPSLRREGGFPVRRDAVTTRITAVDTARTTVLASAGFTEDAQSGTTSAIDRVERAFGRPDTTASGDSQLGGDSATAQVDTPADTATAESNGETFSADRATFIRIQWGDGHVFVSSTPRLFTNVHVLGEESSGAVYRSLSYLDDGATVYWDGHHKPLATQAQTPLRYVASEPALRTAWWTLLAGTFLFLFVHGRRRQRVIPEYGRPSNETLEFIRTVAGLYHRQGNHRGLARQRIRYVLATIRERLDLPTDVIDDDWVDRVAQRSGVPREDVQNLADAIRTVRTSQALTSRQLLNLEDCIQTFRNQRAR